MSFLIFMANTRLSLKTAYSPYLPRSATLISHWASGSVTEPSGLKPQTSTQTTFYPPERHIGICNYIHYGQVNASSHNGKASGVNTIHIIQNYVVPCYVSTLRSGVGMPNHKNGHRFSFRAKMHLDSVLDFGWLIDWLVGPPLHTAESSRFQWQFQPKDGNRPSPRNIIV